MLRKEFDVPAKLRRATAYVTGLGLYEFYLNERKIGDQVLSPGLTDYNKRVLYVTYDVTGSLNSGRNAAGLILGNGRYWSPRLQIGIPSASFGYPKARCQIELEFTDGSKQVLVTDDSWKMTRGQWARADGVLRQTGEENDVVVHREDHDNIHYVLKALDAADLKALLERALTDSGHGLGEAGLAIEPEALELLAQAGDGDARRALGMLELAAGLAAAAGGGRITAVQAREVAAGGRRRFDKGGEQFYDQISALHKAVRGSDPDAALYWYARMIDGGCDPHYLARRVLRMASEDIGLADPRALSIALEAWQAYERLGSPEGELAIAEAVVYMAVAAKSNAIYTGYGAAQADVERYGTLDVPMQLRNAPTKLMQELGYGSGYRYAHDEPGAFAAGERYLPDGLPDRRYYQPAPRGLELKIGEALARLRERNQNAGKPAPEVKPR
jgi:hypothetical protein